MRNYFCGWYFKCQSADRTLAVIPAVHGESHSIQLITDDGAWNFTDNLKDNSFSKDGLSLNLLGPGIAAFGAVRFGDFSTIKYDIMGPFKYVPFMECRHSIVSMKHQVDGMISINGVEYRFDNDLGYIEGDRGYSFPREYAWTQCFFDDNSLMFSIADIPFVGWRFTGIIGVVLWRGKEYRFATYLGAGALKIADNEFVIRQGKYRFTARLLERRAHMLNAPICGNMVRTIHESASCPAAYCLEQNGKKLFEFQTNQASFEFEYGGKKHEQII